MATTKLSLPFGDTQLTTDIPSDRLLGIVVPGDQAAIHDEEETIRRALANPIGTGLLADSISVGQKVVIVTSDLTRPCPADRILPSVLGELGAAGVPDADITVVVALGLHRPMTSKELERLVGPSIYERVSVINHDPSDTVEIGVTAAGTPVELFSPVVEADARICLGNLEFHWFAGYSGGAKAIFPGCASERAVTANHAMMAQRGAEAGRIVDNPLRADLEEAADMAGVNFILNVIVDAQKRVIEAVAGDVAKAHRRGCELVRTRGAVPIPGRADVVFVSAGGRPTDLNLYQAQKALENAAAAVRDDGIIVWVAECSEGFGNATFESWIREAASAEEILTRIERKFVIGGHKAAAIAAAVRRARVYLVSALPAGAIGNVGVLQTGDLTEAAEMALDEAGDEARVLAMPRGGSTFPVTSDSGSAGSL